MSLTRRHFLKYSSGIASSFAFTNLQAELLPTNNDQIHLAIARLAKEVKYSNTLTLLLPQGSEFNVAPVASLFTELTGVLVNLETVPVDDINTRMLLDKRLNNISWDIALPATFGVPDLAEAKAIADLSALREQYEPDGFNDNNYYSLGDFYQNRFYGYQSDGDVYMMFYNQMLNTQAKQTEFADKFNHSYRLPITWNELDAHMEFFHDPNNDIYGGSLFRTPNYLVWEFWSRFHAKGYLPLKADLTPNIDNEQGVAVLDDMIRTMDYLHPNARKDGLVDNWKTYSNGNIYANIGWGGTQKYFVANQSKVLGKLRYSSLPGGYINQKFLDTGYFNWGWNYTVSPSAKDTALAYLFTLFAVAPVPSTLAVAQENGFFDPFRQEHYQDPRIQEIYTDEFLRAHKHSMQSCIPDFYLSGQQLYIGELRRYLTAAIDGALPPQQALSAAANSWQNTHNKMGIQKQAKQWAFLRSQYPKDFIYL